VDQGKLNEIFDEKIRWSLGMGYVRVSLKCLNWREQFFKKLHIITNSVFGWAMIFQGYHFNT